MARPRHRIRPQSLLAPGLPLAAQRFALAVAAIAAIAASAAPLAGQPTPAGPDVQVNLYTPDMQARPDVAADAEGNFVVVWQSLGSPGPDDSGWSVQGRRFAADGTPLGTQFEINGGLGTGDQLTPRVARHADGRFVVVWQSNATEDSNAIEGRRFAADGTPAGAPFVIGAATTDSQHGPVVGMDSAGGFVVVWSRFVSGSPAPGQKLRARRYAPNGTPLGGPFTVQTEPTEIQLDPALAVAADGHFALVWTSQGSSGTDTDLASVQLRMFAADATPDGDQLQVNELTTGGQSRPAVAMAADGRFVVAWESFASSGTDAYLSVEARRFSATGTPLGAQFQANTYTPGLQDGAGVAVAADGTFVVAWESYGSPGPDIDNSIQLRRFSAAGVPDGAQLQVNTVMASSQGEPRIAASPRGDLAVAWHSLSSAGNDPEWSIQSRRFDALFRDGFASGDTARWSSSQP